MSVLARLSAWWSAWREVAAPAASTAAPIASARAPASPATPMPVLAVGDAPLAPPLPVPGAPAAHSVATAPPADRLWRGDVPPEVYRLSEVLEGYSNVPYRDSGGVWTIGYGSTRDLVGKPVGPHTPPVTRDEAERMARRDLAQAARWALDAFPDGLPPRWGAVAILTCNNMGDMRVWGATLRRLLLARDWRGAANQLAAYRNADGKPVLGLRRRRWAEAAYALGMNEGAARQRAWAEIRSVDDWPPLP